MKVSRKSSKRSSRRSSLSPASDPLLTDFQNSEVLDVTKIDPKDSSHPSSSHGYDTPENEYEDEFLSSLSLSSPPILELTAFGAHEDQMSAPALQSPFVRPCTINDDYVLAQTHDETNTFTRSEDSRPISGDYWVHMYHSMVNAMNFYTSLSWQELKRHKMNFSIGFLSILLSVMVGAIISTVVYYAPLVILNETENDTGQYDIKILPDKSPYLNYSSIGEASRENSEKYDIDKRSSPRYLYNVSAFRFWLNNCTHAFNYSDTSELYSYTYGETRCETSFDDTYSKACKHSYAGALWLLDLKKEERIHVGRKLHVKNGLKANEAYVSEKTAAAHNIKVGDTLLFELDYQNDQQHQILYSMYKDAKLYEDYKYTTAQLINAKYVSKYCQKSVFPAVITRIVESTGDGKFGSDELFDFIVEFNTFANSTFPTLPKPMKTNAIFTDKWTNTNFINWNQLLVMTIPDRISVYLSNNYDTIQSYLVRYASVVLYYIGFTTCDVLTPTLSKFKELEYAALFLSLLLNVILLVLVVLSIMLLYSLLIISVDTRVFDIAILRMLGMKRLSIVNLLITQAFSHSIPAYVVGIIISEICVIVFIEWLNDFMGLSLFPMITSSGWLRASLIGLIIPIVASISPIRNAFHRNIHESLDTHKRHSMAGIEYKLERSENEGISKSVLLISLILVAFGFSIYYLLPLAIVSLNLSLLLSMFFLLMISMLVGLLLLAMNIQHIIERFLLKLLFTVWEYKEIPHIVFKNLCGHRHRNRKTSLMYGTSLGFIIMVSVVYHVQIVALQQRKLASQGAYMLFHIYSHPYVVREVEKSMETFKYCVQHYTFYFDTNYIFEDEEHRVFAYDYSKIAKHSIAIEAIPPDYQKAAVKSLYASEMENSNTKLTVDQQLYTAKGSQNWLIATYLKREYGMGSLDDKMIIELNHHQIFSVKSLAYINVYPGVKILSKFPIYWTGVGISIPTLVTLSQYESAEDLRYEGFLLKFRKNATDADKDTVYNYFKNQKFVSYSYDFRNFEEIINESNTIMDRIFSIAIVIALFLCLFSLIASMYSNILEQSKEIGILRAMGLNYFQMYRIYVYEAFILVLSSSILGVVIGAMVGFTMGAQIALYSDYPIYFEMPYQLLWIVSVAAFLSAFFSVIVPLKQLMKYSISTVIRFVF